MSRLEEHIKQQQKDLHFDQQEQQEEQFLFRTETVDISNFEIEESVYDKQKSLGLGEGAEEPELAASYVKENIRQKLIQTTFLERTEYYFHDPKYMEAKKERYKSLANEDNNELDLFAKKHTNRSASKRKSKANDAADCFEKARKLEEKLVKKEEDAVSAAKPLKALDRYKAREEIMRVRMEGMINAAKAKSTSNKNEEYRIAKAKISCLSVLLDQANMLKNEKEATAFLKIAKGLQKEMAAAEKQLAKNSPDLNEQWHESLGLNDKNFIQEKLKEARKSVPSANEEDVKIQTMLHSLTEPDHAELEENIAKANKAHAFKNAVTQRGDEILCVYHYVKKDKNGVPINKEEMKKEEWNKHWTEVAIDPTRELERKQLLIEAYQRYEKMEFPTPEELREKGIMSLFKENPAKIMAIVRNCLGFDNIRKNGEDFLDEMARTNPMLHKKIQLGVYIGTLFSEVHKNLHGIFEAGFYSFSQTNFIKLPDQDEEDQERYYNFVKDQEEEYTAVYDSIIALKKAREEGIRIDAKVGREDKVKNLEEFKKDPANRFSDNDPFYAGAEKSHEVYLSCKGVNMIMQNPYYQEGFKRAEKEMGYEISRSLGVVLRECKFDRNWIPVTQKDMDAHLWNLKVLYHMDIAAAGRELDVGELASIKKGITKLIPEAEKEIQDKSRASIVEMTKEEIDRIYGSLTDFPSPEELKKQFLEPLSSQGKELNVPYFETLLQNPERIADVFNHSLSLEVLANKFPEIDDYWKTHPEYATRFEANRNLGSIFDMYCMLKYHLTVDTGGGNTKIRKTDPDPEILMANLMVYENAYNELK